MNNNVRFSVAFRYDRRPLAEVAPILCLPELPPLSATNRSLRQQGTHIHRICFDRAAVERERLARKAGLTQLSSERAVLWYFKACTIDDWYDGTQEVCIHGLRAELDRAGEFPHWKDFVRETLANPLADLHAHADFQVRYQAQRRKGKIVAVRFHLERTNPTTREA